MRALPILATLALALGATGTILASCTSDDPPKGQPTPVAAAAAPDAAIVCPAPKSGMPARPLSILFFTRQNYYIHNDAHDAGETTVPAALRSRGHTVNVTDDVATFTPEALARFDVIVFFVTSGSILVDPIQRAAFRSFLHSGRGIAGAHTATETDMDWYEGGQYVAFDMWGTRFLGHGVGPAGISEAGLIIDDAASPTTAFLPNPWIREDEWYYYTRNPAMQPNVRTLTWLDESWIAPLWPNYADAGFYGAEGHPISWTNEFECSRIFYTAIGHTGSSWMEDLVIRHLVAGIEWAGVVSTSLR